MFYTMMQNSIVLQDRLKHFQDLLGSTHWLFFIPVVSSVCSPPAPLDPIFHYGLNNVFGIIICHYWYILPGNITFP